MITTDKLTVRFGSQTLFENVSIKFTPGNCYGVIGANGAGKSTLLKVIAGDIEPTSGEVHITKGQRIAVLRQDHFAFDDYKVIDTVIMGHKKLYDIMQERDALYAKPDFNDEDGIKVAHLEEQFAELDGWQAEAMAASLLSDLGIPDELHYEQMSELAGSEKVRVLLAQALFGNPDILLLDEPTNHLDLNTIAWLEEFLINFQNLVIVVSHDRKFLDNVCTHMADIDYKNIQLYTGNYSFWSQASQLIKKQKEEQNKKTEEKMEELKAFIARFSANASKAKQATSRKNMLDKLSLEEIKPSSRQYPRIRFTYNKIPGKDVLHVKNLNKTVDGELLIKNLSFEINQGEKVAFIARDPFIISNLFDILEDRVKPDSGEVIWGVTATHSYFPKDNSAYFEGCEDSLIEWLRPCAKEGEQYDADIRGWLGRMLFSGEEATKQAKVLSGGERVRCMLCRMMMSGANVMILDEPTNHLDLESITAVNEGLVDFKGTLLFDSHDHQFVQTIADRIIEILPGGVIDRQMTYDEYIENEDIDALRAKWSVTDEA